MKTDTLRVGFIGAGNRGTSLLTNMFSVENVIVTAICDPNPDAVKEAGIPTEELRATIEQHVLALNEQLPNYSKITVCEIMDQPFEKTPKLSIKRFMYK